MKRKAADAGAPTIGARGVALIVATALFMINLDATIISTSLPQMAATFAVSPIDMNTAITAYMLAVAAFIPASGWIADRFGAKPVFAAAIALFTLASAACALTPSFRIFLLARAVQGLGGALIVPIGRIIVLHSARKEDIVDAIALITWPALIAPVAGPVLGGAITSSIGWHWNFLLNLPIGIVGLVLVATKIPDLLEDVGRRLDILGAILISGTLVLLIFGLERIARPDEFGKGAAMIGASLLLGAGAILWLRRAPTPLIDLSPFGLRTFNVATLDAGVLYRIAISATPFLLPLMLQETWGLSPVRAGVVLLIYFLGNLSMKSVTTPILRWFGFRTVLLGNGLLLSASILAFAFLAPGTPRSWVWAVAFVAGATRSMQMTALNTLGFADIGPAQRSAASTLSGMMQQVSMALGIALAALLLRASQDLAGRVTVDAGDFRFAFFTVAAMALAGAALLARLESSDGREVSGHRRRSPF